MAKRGKPFLAFLVSLISGFLFLWSLDLIINERTTIDQTINSLVLDHRDGICKSRFEQHRYRRRVSQYVPSPYLVQRLRAYEEFHAYCAENLINTSNSEGDPDCKFIIWKSYSGLGNKIISIVSTFVYALLTNRVLLIEPGPDAYMEELFCEPFPASSWWTFPLEKLRQPRKYDRLIFDDPHFCKDGSSISPEFERYGSLEITDSFVGLGDKFFCEHAQKILRNRVPLLTVTANLYFIPSLYNVASFKIELDKLFPEQETVFHHLSRYLIHPSDRVWNIVTSFYKDHMANSSKVIGIQMRPLGHLGFTGTNDQSFHDSMVQCTQQQGLLPEPAKNEELVSRFSDRSITAVVTSLSNTYADRLRQLYSNGSVVTVSSPSHEMHQRVDDLEHEEKALAEMFLLSFCDELVTSPASTFGYVAQGLAGIRPWVLDREKNCSRLTSMEPCFHARVKYGCECSSPKDAIDIQQNIQNCQDVTWGIQLKSSRK